MPPAAVEATMNAFGTITEFNEISRGAFHLFVFPITPWAIEGLSRDVDDAMFSAITDACAKWMRRAVSAPKHQRPTCVDCDVEFSRKVFPAGFVVALPFANKASLAMVSGVCLTCIAKDDLGNRTMRRLQQIWPDLRVATGGNA
jgi:hypothetical protein